MALNRENIVGQMPDDGGSVGLPWRLFSFILILFMISLFGYIGLQFGYKPFLEKQSAAIQVEIDALNLNLDLGTKKELIAFYSQIVNLKDLLKNHVFTSKIFHFLQSSTSKGVAYSTFNLQVQENQIRLDGVALNYDTLVQQLLFWQNSPSVQKIVLHDNSTVENQIRFAATVTFVPSFFTTIDSTVGGGRPMVTPTGNPPGNSSTSAAPGTSTTTTTTTTNTGTGQPTTP